jgi:excinuclease UvrABC ATPase subunit
MTEPLSKDTFETFTREHQKYLDSSFNKLAGCISNIQKSVDEVKVAREKAWETHAEECTACRNCQDKKLKKLHKYVLVGCISAALLGGILAPIIGITEIVAFIKLFLVIPAAAAGIF